MTKTQNNMPEPEVFASNRLDEPTRWFAVGFDAPRLLSAGIHLVVIGFALFPWTSAPAVRTKPDETVVLLYTPSKVLNPFQRADRSGGGGGGGKRESTMASRGVLPRGADKQLAPADPKPPNRQPQLVVEPTIIAPQLSQLRPLTLLNLGDPNGVPGPPSSGTGDGGGIGDGGKGTGVGGDDGPGGPGEKGGNRIFRV